MSILDLDWSLRSQIINAMTPQELHDLMVMQYGSTVNFANSVLLNDPCYDVMSLSILSSSYYNFAAALLNQANPMELQGLWDFYFFPTAMPGNMFQVANDLFNTFDPDIYNKILALDGVKDNFFMTYELDFGFGSLETFLVNYSDFKLCTRNALGDAAIIGIFNLFDQTGLWDAMNSFHSWADLANKMIQYNPDAFLMAGLPYMPQYATNLLENGMYVVDPPSVMQPLYQISLEQFFDSIQSYPGLGEAYMLQLTNQLIALGYASPGWSYLVGEHHLYGSARLGVHQTKKELRNRYKQEEISISLISVNTTTLYRGKRNYELSNHLGNINVVISDKRKSFCDEELGVERFEAEVLSAVDYYPFGKMLIDRQWYYSNDTSLYRFAFNGKEIDREHGGAGNTYDYGFRIYNPDYGKFLSVDPLTQSYPWYTPYQFAGNKPIWSVDLDGLEEYFTSSGELIGKYGNSTEIRIVFDKYVEAAKDIINNQKNHDNNILNNILYNKGSAGVFTNPDDAAADWGIRYNKNSIEDKKEYSSFIFVTKINGKSAISYTLPDIGDETSAISTFKPNKKSTPIATIHSHANYHPEMDNNNFSIDYYDEYGQFHEGDIGNDDRSLLSGYLTTSNGSLQRHIIFSNPETIRCDMPYDPNDPTTRPDQISSEQELKVD